jgi:hypothetical protein
MAVKFISHVEENGLGEWFINLTDTLENETFICNNLDEYKEKIEELGAEYGNDIEVVWTKSKTLSPKNISDLNEKMALLQKEYEQEINQINQQNGSES